MPVEVTYSSEQTFATATVRSAIQGHQTDFELCALHYFHLKKWVPDDCGWIQIQAQIWIQALPEQMLDLNF